MDNKFSLGELAKGMFVVCFIGFAFLWLASSLFLKEKVKLIEVVDNKINVPSSTYDGIGGQEEPKEANLISSPRISKNLYNPSIYKEESIDVAFKGEFETIELRVVGNIADDLLHFLFVGFGTVNGTYGVDRLSAGEIQYDPMSVFTKDDSERNIDLMSEIKLSNSLKEVQKGFSPSKSRKLWDYIWPPVNKNNASIVNMAVGLYDENLTFGSEIENLQILYRCKDSDPNCKVAVCEKGKYPNGTACLDALFGNGSGDNYGKQFKLLINH